MLELPSSEAITAYCDEVGRGTLCFDVVAAAVILPPRFPAGTEGLLEQIRDSKLLSPAKRERLAAFIRDIAVAWAVGSASAEEVDRENILNATFLAMHRALDGLHAQGARFERIEVDGSRFKPWFPPSRDSRDPPPMQDWLPFECVVDGDAKVLGIAAASILAKVHRDRAIAELCDRHPELDKRYALRSNKGYGTKTHLEGLRLHGPSAWHRCSFAPVARLVVPDYEGPIVQG